VSYGGGAYVSGMCWAGYGLDNSSLNGVYPFVSTNNGKISYSNSTGSDIMWNGSIWVLFVPGREYYNGITAEMEQVPVAGSPNIEVENSPLNEAGTYWREHTPGVMDVDYQFYVRGATSAEMEPYEEPSTNGVGPGKWFRIEDAWEWLHIEELAPLWPAGPIGEWMFIPMRQDPLTGEWFGEWQWTGMEWDGTSPLFPDIDPPDPYDPWGTNGWPVPYGTNVVDKDGLYSAASIAFLQKLTELQSAANAGQTVGFESVVEAMDADVALTGSAMGFVPDTAAALTADLAFRATNSLSGEEECLSNVVALVSLVEGLSTFGTGYDSYNSFVTGRKYILDLGVLPILGGSGDLKCDFSGATSKVESMRGFALFISYILQAQILWAMFGKMFG